MHKYVNTKQRGKQLKNKAIIIVLVLVLSFFTQYLIFTLLDWKFSEFLNSSITIDHKYLAKTDIVEAENLQLSYNNKYLSFIKNNSLEVIDLYKNELVFNSSLFLDPSSEMLNYRWLPDRNSLLFFSTGSDQSKTYLYSLDFNNYASTEYIPKLDRELSFSIANILNIEMSTYTNNLYVLFEDAKQTRLIKIDIMKSINWLDIPQENIHNIAVTNKYGNLFVETSDNLSKKIILLDGQERKIVSSHPDDILMGTKDNTVYIGRVDNGYLQELYIYNSDEKGGTLINVWQGKIPYEKKEQQLAVTFTEGTLTQTQFPEGLIVMSPTGNIYLQVIPVKAGFNYYWRTIP